MRIFLDANILFSAVQADGAIRRLLALLVAADHQLIADEYVYEEARRNLEVHAPTAAPDMATRLSSVRVHRIPKHTDLPPTLNLAVKDRPVLASAIALRCDALVTGDKTHFGHLFGSTIEAVAIHSPASIAAQVLN